MIGIALLTVAIMLAVAIDVYGWRTGLLVWAASTGAEHHAVVYEPTTPRRLQAIDVLAGRIVGAVARRQPAPIVHPEFEEAK